LPAVGSSHEVSCLFALRPRGFARRTGFHAGAAFRPQVFSTSRRFAPHVALQACFIPLARPGFALQGFSLARSRPGSSPAPCPLAVTSEAPSLARRTFRRSATGPCSPGESVPSDPRLSESSGRSPLGLSPLQGILHFDRRLRFRRPPLSSLPLRTYETPRQRSPGFSRIEGSVTSLARRPALLRFLALSKTHAFGSDHVSSLFFRFGEVLRRRRTHLSSLTRALSLPTGAA